MTARLAKSEIDKIIARSDQLEGLAKAARVPTDTADGLSAAKVRLARVEYVLEILRSHHVAKGFKLDEDAAARVLRYFQKRTRCKANRKADHTEFRFALDFLYDHGQSGDWVFMGRLGPMICQAAAQSPRLPRRAKAHLSVVQS
jgi:hypothetical protein